MEIQRKKCAEIDMTNFDATECNTLFQESIDSIAYKIAAQQKKIFEYCFKLYKVDAVEEEISRRCRVVMIGTTKELRIDGKTVMRYRDEFGPITEMTENYGYHFDFHWSCSGVIAPDGQIINAQNILNL
jgi:hypothetical protein